MHDNRADEKAKEEKFRKCLLEANEKKFDGPLSQLKFDRIHAIFAILDDNCKRPLAKLAPLDPKNPPTNSLVNAGE